MLTKTLMKKYTTKTAVAFEWLMSDDVRRPLSQNDEQDWHGRESSACVMPIARSIQDASYALCSRNIIQFKTIRTRTPALWGSPPPPHDYPYYWPVHFESQVHTMDQFISDPNSKQGERLKIRKISEKLKFRNFVINIKHDPLSNGSDYLWQVWK